MNTPRAKTVTEIRNELLNQIRDIAKYWATLPDKTPQERCDGVAFSILNIFDGSTITLPSFDLLTSPHPDDKQYSIDNDENWYEPGLFINDCMLHELYHT